MMHAVGLMLLVSSLAAAGVWSPPPERGGEPASTSGDVLVKEGHRVIVVEYEREGLRPSATPRQVVEESASVERAIGESKGVGDKVQQKKTRGASDEEKLKEAASVLPNLGLAVSPGGEETEVKQGKICDALGSCKEKISGAFAAAKEKVVDVHDKISSRAADMEASAKEAARKAVHGGEDVAEKVKNASEKQMGDVVSRAKKVKDSAAETVGSGAEKIKHGGSETAQEVAGEAKEKAQRAYGRFEEKAREVKEKAQDVYGRAEKAREAGNKVLEAAERSQDAAAEGKRNITDIIQRGRDVLYDAAMYTISPETLGSLMRLLHSLAFSVVYGTCFWVTFVSSHVLARALPRQQLGVVQSKLYPVYFRTLTYGIGICLITHYLSRRWSSASRADKLQAFNLLASLGFVLVNMLYIEPRATKASSLTDTFSRLFVMYDRLKLEKEEGRGRDMDDMDQVEAPVTANAADAAVTGSAAAEVTTTSAAPRRVDLEKEAVKSRLVKMNKRLKILNSYSSLLNMVALMGLTWHLVFLSQEQHHQQLGC
ncbi:Transmembrane protein [Nymphaea thermarum]|nr:Transmembrane protein [Nymphaea thermarum]